MFLLTIAAIGLSIIYFKLLVPFLYWHRKNIYYITPWMRFYKFYLGKEPLVQSMKLAYSEHPQRRYYGSYQFLQPSLFVRDLDLIKQITIKDFEHFTDHGSFTSDKIDPILGQNLFSLKGQKWREMRSTLSPVFTATKMKLMFNLMSETAESFTNYFWDKNEDLTVIELREQLIKYTNDVIANCAFGIKCNSLSEEHNDFYTMGKEFTSPSSGSILRTLLYAFLPKVGQFLRISAFSPQVISFFSHLIQENIKAREQNGIIRPDMVHLLLEAKKGRIGDKSDSKEPGFAAVEESNLQDNLKLTEITDELITAQALVFFIAGLSTSSSLLSFLMYELAINPHCQRKLHNEIDFILSQSKKISYENIPQMKYLDQVISEALRKWPPAFALNRLCVKDYTIPVKNHGEDVIIEKGCLVTISVIGLHWDPQYFPEPEKFDPDRFSDENRTKIVAGSYMPFGIGPRNCIGSRFALLEMKALVINLLSKFEIVAVDKTEIPLKLAKTFTLESKNGIWLGLQRRTT